MACGGVATKAIRVQDGEERILYWDVQKINNDKRKLALTFVFRPKGLVTCALWLFTSLVNAQSTAAINDEARYQQALQWMAEGRYTQAREGLLQLLAQQPAHAGAWLDLALLHCLMGQGNEAKVLFAEVSERFAPPAALREAIESLSQQGCGREPAKFSARLRLGLGTDSNVNQGASNPSFTLGSGANATPLMLAAEYTPRADQFKALVLEGSLPVGTDGVLAYAQAQARQHNHFPQYDLGAVVLGLENPWQWGPWGWRANVSAALTALDGALYQRQVQLQLKALAPSSALLPPPWQLPAGWLLGGSGTWTGASYPTLSGFDSQVWEVRGVLAYESEGRSAQASAGYALDQGQTQRPGADRSGAVLGLGARLPMGGLVSAELGVSLQSWRGDQAYSPGLIDDRRQQTSLQLRAALAVPLAARQALHFELRHVRNNENVSVFTYQGSQLQLSWVCLLPL